MRVFLCLISVDPSLGRIDKHSLSQQTLMELLIGGFSNREVLCGSKENPKKILQWEGLQFNKTREIFEIIWSYRNLQGSIELKWLPLRVGEVYLQINKLSGGVDLTCLPDSLQILILSWNQFEGKIDLTALPRGMQKLGLSKGKFTGTIDFNQLPQSLTYLAVTSTQLEGTVYEFDGELLIENSNVKDMRVKKP